MASTRAKPPTSLADLPALRGAAVGRLLTSRIAAASEDVQRIIDSAYRVIQRESEPDFELKMRDIVEEAGISTQSFYKLFGSKDEFILILIEHGSKVFEGNLLAGLAERPDPLERVEYWVRAVMNQAVDAEMAEKIRPFIVHIPRLTALRTKDLEDMRAGILDPLRDAIAELGPQIGETQDPGLIAELIYNLVFSFMHAQVLRRRQPPADEQNAVVRICMRALGITSVIAPSRVDA